MSGGEVSLHPSVYALDAFAVGDASSEVESHVASCEACERYVRELRAELGATKGPSGDAFFAALPEAARAPNSASPSKSNVVRFVPAASMVLALAAGVILFLKQAPLGTDGVTPNATETASSVRFKGGLGLAIIRDRNGSQERFTDAAYIQSGDRLRAEVAVDHESPIEVGILEEGGAYVPLLLPTSLSLGTHFSDKAAKVDLHPSPGWVLAGHPDSVRKARETRDFTQVRVIPIRVQ